LQSYSEWQDQQCNSSSLGEIGLGFEYRLGKVQRGMIRPCSVKRSAMQTWSCAKIPVDEPKPGT